MKIGFKPKPICLHTCNICKVWCPKLIKNVWGSANAQTECEKLYYFCHFEIFSDWKWKKNPITLCDLTFYFMQFFPMLHILAIRGQKVIFSSFLHPSFSKKSMKWSKILTKLSGLVPYSHSRSSWPTEACRIGPHHWSFTQCRIWG